MTQQRSLTRPQIQFGSFRRLTPISRFWGSDWGGQPVDRRYIENFLKRHADDIRGRVLEFHNNSYTRIFGGSRVTKSDVLNVEEGNPKSTFVGDLATAHHLPADAFDCIIMTQVLQFVYDLRGAIFTLHRILKPNGVILATMPGIIPIHPEEWSFYWSVTAAAAERLFNERFPSSAIEIESHGNVLAAISLLHGLASEELENAELDHKDPSYPVVIAVRVVKPAGQ
jgi:SAM-dependent methyltransferase